MANRALADKAYQFLKNFKDNAAGVASGAGKYFLEADEGAAKRVADFNFMGLQDSGQRQFFEAQPISNVLKAYQERKQNIDMFPQDSDGRQALDHAMNFLNAGMIGGANLGVRYGLPAAGVTLAGKALYDLTVAFGGGADQQERGQLPLA